jgi:hypothetical protein
MAINGAIKLFSNIDNTLSVSIYIAYNFWSKSNFVKFDYVFSKIYQLLWYQISIIRIIVKYTFILYIFGITDVDIFYYIHNQSLLDLTFPKNYTQHILGRRE